MRIYGSSFPVDVLPPIRAQRLNYQRPINVDHNCIFCAMPEEATQQRDYSSYNATATMAGPTLTQLGRWGPAWYFNGAGDYITFPNDTYLDLTDNFTLEAWCKPTDLTAVTHFMVVGDMAGVGGLGYALDFYGPSPRFYVDAVRPVGTDQTVNTWIHFVGTYTTTPAAANVKAYINGILNATANDNSGCTVTGLALSIGRPSGVAANYFKGYIDEVRIYNRVLSPQEIYALYEYGRIW